MCMRGYKCTCGYVSVYGWVRACLCGCERTRKYAIVYEWVRACMRECRCACRELV